MFFCADKRAQLKKDQPELKVRAFIGEEYHALTTPLLATCSPIVPA